MYIFTVIHAHCRSHYKYYMLIFFLEGRGLCPSITLMYTDLVELHYISINMINFLSNMVIYFKTLLTHTDTIKKIKVFRWDKNKFRFSKVFANQ